MPIVPIFLRVLRVLRGFFSLKTEEPGAAGAVLSLFIFPVRPVVPVEAFR